MHHAAHRFETATRYYVLLVQRNLFEEWELVRMWGGRTSCRGSMLCQPATSEAHAQVLLSQTSRKRERRGYHRAGCDAPTG